MWVALLRGINVGGKNKLPMAGLVELFEELGCRDVRTYIQSGNVIFNAPAKLAPKVAERATGGIGERYGYDVPVVVRRARDLTEAVRLNPFVGDADTAHLSLAFLATRPTASAVATLDPEHSLPDRFAVIGREIHLYLPNGAARTKLTNRYFDSRLGTVSTARNWRTVQELIVLTGAGS